MNRRLLGLVALLAPFVMLLTFVFNVGGIETRFATWLAHSAQDAATHTGQTLKK